MLPFCGYHMGDYFAHWLRLGQSLRSKGARLPAIFAVNWFRTDAQGRFVWPGFGENARVLEWMIARIEGSISQGQEHAVGVSPRFEDIDWAGLAFERQAFDQLTAIEATEWLAELREHDLWLERLGDRLPAELLRIRSALGSAVMPLNAPAST
jgi:phosphoenolpyruvate carboxykinase (GTP)